MPMANSTGEWSEPTDFDFHVFRAACGDFIMYPAGPDRIEVDLCLWEDMGPLDVPEAHPLHGQTLKMPRPASD
jgi:hypothetical protein